MLSLRRALPVATLAAAISAACGGSGTAASTGPDAAAAIDGATGSSGGPDAASDTGVSPPPDASDAATAPDTADGAAPDLVAQLLALTAKCTVASNGKYATDDGVAATIDVCKLNGAFFWKADMDIDCDGQSTAECNLQTDPAYQNQTSFTQSDGKPLIASVLPYVVVPLPSTRFDYTASNIQPGALVIVLYAGQLNYGVFGDEGPNNIIGEASYAMGKSLGVDPNPATGGVDSGVTYIVFTGQTAVVSPIESHPAAVTLGTKLAQDLLKNN